MRRVSVSLKIHQKHQEGEREKQPWRGDVTLTWCTVPSISTGMMKSALFTGWWGDRKR